MQRKKLTVDFIYIDHKYVAAMVDYKYTQMLYCIAYLHMYRIPNISDYIYTSITLGDSSVYIIVGVIIGVIIVVTLLFIMFCCLWRRKGTYIRMYVHCKCVLCSLSVSHLSDGILQETKCVKIFIIRTIIST